MKEKEVTCYKMKRHIKQRKLKTDEISKEMYNGTKRHFCRFLPQIPSKSHKVNIYFCWLVVQRNRVTVVFSVLQYRMFTVQIVSKLYCLELNCTWQ